MDEFLENVNNSLRRCGLCCKPSSYSCPRCGINYCSLECYRSPKHSVCSEAFYKDCCIQSLKKNYANLENKKKMQDILYRQSIDQITKDPVDSPSSDDTSESDKDNDDSSLSIRLAGINFDSEDIDTEIIWSRLTVKERREFCRFLSSSKASDVIPTWSPWWSVAKGITIEEFDSTVERSQSAIANLSSPMQMRNLFPSGKMPHTSVYYSLADVLLGYAFVCRIYNGDHKLLFEESTVCLCDIVGSFDPMSKKAVQKKQDSAELTRSRTRILTKPVLQTYTCLSDVIGSVQTRLAELKQPCSPEMMIVLLQDLTQLSSSRSHIRRALDDAHGLIMHFKSNLISNLDIGRTEKRIVAADRKLMFLRSCMQPDDALALTWQDVAIPCLQRALSAELYTRLTGLDQSVSVRRPGAGPNWRQMIRQTRDDNPHVVDQLCTEFTN